MKIQSFLYKYGAKAASVEIRNYISVNKLNPHLEAYIKTMADNLEDALTELAAINKHQAIHAALEANIPVNNNIRPGNPEGICYAGHIYRQKQVNNLKGLPEVVDNKPKFNFEMTIPVSDKVYDPME